MTKSKLSLSLAVFASVLLLLFQFGSVIATEAVLTIENQASEGKLVIANGTATAVKAGESATLSVPLGAQTLEINGPNGQLQLPITVAGDTTVTIISAVVNGQYQFAATELSITPVVEPVAPAEPTAAPPVAAPVPTAEPEPTPHVPTIGESVATATCDPNLINADTLQSIESYRATTSMALESNSSGLLNPTHMNLRTLMRQQNGVPTQMRLDGSITIDTTGVAVETFSFSDLENTTFSIIYADGVVYFKEGDERFEYARVPVEEIVNEIPYSEILEADISDALLSAPCTARDINLDGTPKVQYRFANVALPIDGADLAAFGLGDDISVTATLVEGSYIFAPYQDTFFLENIQMTMTLQYDLSAMVDELMALDGLTAEDRALLEELRYLSLDVRLNHTVSHLNTPDQVVVPFQVP